MNFLNNGLNFSKINNKNVGYEVSSSLIEEAGSEQFLEFKNFIKSYKIDNLTSYQEAYNLLDKELSSEVTIEDNYANQKRKFFYGATLVAALRRESLRLARDLIKENYL